MMEGVMVRVMVEKYIERLSSVCVVKRDGEARRGYKRCGGSQGPKETVTGKKSKSG
jgi:hypothetical protein